MKTLFIKIIERRVMKEENKGKSKVKTGLKVLAISALVTSEFIKAMKTVRWG